MRWFSHVITLFIFLSLVLDEVQFFVKSRNRGSKLYDFQSGRTITEVEKPLPKIQMHGQSKGRRTDKGAGMKSLGERSENG